VKIRGKKEAEKVYGRSRVQSYRGVWLKSLQDFLSRYVWDGRALVVALGNKDASVPVAVPENHAQPQSPTNHCPNVPGHWGPPSMSSFVMVVPLQPEYRDDRLLVSSMPGALPSDIVKARYEVCVQAYSHFMAEAYNAGTLMRIQAAAAERESRMGNLQQAAELSHWAEVYRECQSYAEAEAATARARIAIHAQQVLTEVGRENLAQTPYVAPPLPSHTISPSTPVVITMPTPTPATSPGIPVLMQQPQPYIHVTYPQAVPLYVNAPNGTPINLTHGAVQTEARGIFIGGLPYEAEWQELKDRLKAAGNVIRCEVPKRSNDGRGKGYATALFSSHEEAKAAVQMFHDTEFKGRTIRVKLDAQKTTMRPQSTGTSEDPPANEPVRQPIVVDGSSSSCTISASQSPKTLGKQTRD
jgi:RNA recognition motif. (a.k.a. RRM, RBD, or RNP domain)